MGKASWVNQQLKVIGGLSVRWIFDLDNRIYLSPCLPLQNIWPLGLYKHGFMQMYTAYFSGSGSACHSVS